MTVAHITTASMCRAALASGYQARVDGYKVTDNPYLSLGQWQPTLGAAWREGWIRSAEFISKNRR